MLNKSRRHPSRQRPAPQHRQPLRRHLPGRRRPGHPTSFEGDSRRRRLPRPRNLLKGGLGNDELHGGGGNDTLLGGAGDDLPGRRQRRRRPGWRRSGDTYWVDAAGDVVTELDKGGIDRIKTNLTSYILSDNVENLSYTGVAAFTGTGNALANRIVGGEGADTLSGGEGADTLLGGPVTTFWTAAKAPATSALARLRGGQRRRHREGHRRRS